MFGSMRWDEAMWNDGSVVSGGHLDATLSDAAVHSATISDAAVYSATISDASRS